MINPMKMMQYKEMVERFKRSHAKVEPFFRAAMNSLQEGSIIEMRVTNPNGQELRSNIRVNAEDMQLLKEINEFGKTQ
ncbi:MAG: hypothetical protein Q4C61_07055 [Lachnospiraceae bacterium]|nr:hypothetical protein [Lachnospiraceae bacterium]